VTPDEAIDAVARWTGLRLTIIDLRRCRPFVTDRTEHAGILRDAVADLAAVEAELLAAGLIRPRGRSRKKSA
jgi:hypothetical protein